MWWNYGWEAKLGTWDLKWLVGWVTEIPWSFIFLSTWLGLILTLLVPLGWVVDSGGLRWRAGVFSALGGLRAEEDGS